MLSAETKELSRSDVISLTTLRVSVASEAKYGSTIMAQM